jgi:hypothetical protein
LPVLRGGGETLILSDRECVGDRRLPRPCANVSVMVTLTARNVCASRNARSRRLPVLPVSTSTRRPLIVAWPLVWSFPDR